MYVERTTIKKNNPPEYSEVNFTVKTYILTPRAYAREGIYKETPGADHGADQ